jgi:hypothetical protein
MDHVMYTESTDTWALQTSTGSGSGHGLDHLVCDPVNGDLYFAGYNNGPLWKKPYGQPWNLSFASFPHGSNITYGVEFWTGSLTGITGDRGAVMIWDCGYFGQMWGWDVEDTGWRVDDASLPQLAPPGYNGVAAYNQNSNVMIYGGGNSNDQKIARYNSNATPTTLTDLPAGAKLGIYRGFPVADPASGKFMLFTGDSVLRVWDIDPTGSGTYTQMTDSRWIPPGDVHNAAGATNATCNVVLLRNYGVVWVISNDSNGNLQSAYLYRHN